MELPSYLTLSRKSKCTLLDFEALTAIGANSGFCPRHPKQTLKGWFSNNAKVRKENNLKLQTRLIEFKRHKILSSLLRMRRVVTAGEEILYEYNDIKSF